MQLLVVVVVEVVFPYPHGSSPPISQLHERSNSINPHAHCMIFFIFRCTFSALFINRCTRNSKYINLYLWAKRTFLTELRKELFLSQFFVAVILHQWWNRWETHLEAKYDCNIHWDGKVAAQKVDKEDCVRVDWVPNKVPEKREKTYLLRGMLHISLESRKINRQEPCEVEGSRDDEFSK